MATGGNPLCLGLDWLSFIEMKIALSGISQITWVPDPESIERRGIDSSQSCLRLQPTKHCQQHSGCAETQHVQVVMGKKELPDVRYEQTGSEALNWGTPPVLGQADCTAAIPAHLHYFLMDRRCFVLGDQTVFSHPVCVSKGTQVLLSSWHLKYIALLLMLKKHAKHIFKASKIS